MNKNILDIKTIRKYIATRKIEWTKHCLKRLNQRNILTIDIKMAINNGKIIEYYLDDYPYPSCLILGNGTTERTLHIVCGISSERLYIITAYNPDTDNWEDDMETRRKE